MADATAQAADSGPAARPGVLKAIGETPVVKLDRLAEPGSAEVWVKLESHNPTGSYKDRMALAMIEGAERSGRLRPGQTVVEYTGGSTGSSLALVCALKGYPLRIVAYEQVAAEKIRTMQAFGAEVEIMPSPGGITATTVPNMAARAAEIAREVGGFQTDQLNNTDMITGYQSLGAELNRQLEGRIDAFVAYVGTGGCFLGVTRTLRTHLPALWRGVVEPAESAVLSGRAPTGGHLIEGGGIGRMPPLMTRADFDEAFAVSTGEAFAMARRAARTDGLFSGPSTGANLVAALELARRLGPGKRVATVLVDSGLKYLGGELYA